MDLKMWECERETRTEEEQNNKEVDISMHTIVFTLGTFLLMVCLKKFLVEQWRAWVFLVLNIILLAILFMSFKPGFFGLSDEKCIEQVKSDKKVKDNNNEQGNKECIKKSQCWGSSSSSSSNVNVDVENEIIDEDLDEDEEEEEQVLVLSKEELNERVEAFIAMFRQHLMSDVKESEDFRFQKTANHFANKIQVPCC